MSGSLCAGIAQLAGVKGGIAWSWTQKNDRIAAVVFERENARILFQRPLRRCRYQSSY